MTRGNRSLSSEREALRQVHDKDQTPEWVDGFLGPLPASGHHNPEAAAFLRNWRPKPHLLIRTTKTKLAEVERDAKIRARARAMKKLDRETLNHERAARRQKRSLKTGGGEALGQSPTPPPPDLQMERETVQTFRRTNGHWLRDLSEAEQEQLISALLQNLRGELSTPKWRNILETSKVLAGLD